MNFTQEQYEAYLHRNAPKNILKSNPADAETYESDLHDKIIAECRRRGWYYVHSRMDRRTTTGIGVPDFTIALPNGIVWWIECKAKGKKRTTEQLAVGVMLEHLGHNYGLVYSIQEFLTLINTPKTKTTP